MDFSRRVTARQVVIPFRLSVHHLPRQLGTTVSRLAHHRAVPGWLRRMSVGYSFQLPPHPATTAAVMVQSLIMFSQIPAPQPEPGISIYLDKPSRSRRWPDLVSLLILLQTITAAIFQKKE